MRNLVNDETRANYVARFFVVYKSNDSGMPGTGNAGLSEIMVLGK
jgi:hypothetical protein